MMVFSTRLSSPALAMWAASGGNLAGEETFAHPEDSDLEKYVASSVKEEEELPVFPTKYGSEDERAAAFAADDFHDPLSPVLIGCPGTLSLASTPVSSQQRSRPAVSPLTQLEDYSWLPPEEDAIDPLQLPDSFVDAWLDERGLHRFHFRFSPTQLGSQAGDRLREWLRQLQADYSESVQNKDPTVADPALEDQGHTSRSSLPNLPSPRTQTLPTAQFAPLPASPISFPTRIFSPSPSPLPLSPSSTHSTQLSPREHISATKATRKAARLARQIAALDEARHDIYRRYLKYVAISRQ